MEASGQAASPVAPIRSAKAYWASTSATWASRSDACVASWAPRKPQHVHRSRRLVAAFQHHGHRELRAIGLLGEHLVFGGPLPHSPIGVDGRLAIACPDRAAGSRQGSSACRSPAAAIGPNAARRSIASPARPAWHRAAPDTSGDAAEASADLARGRRPRSAIDRLIGRPRLRRRRAPRRAARRAPAACPRAVAGSLAAALLRGGASVGSFLPTG